MNFFVNSLAKKLWFTVTVTIIVTVCYSFFLSHLFYEKLYVEKVEQSLVDEGERLQLDYTGGPLSNTLRDKIEWYNTKSETEVFVVSNPKELSACLPFEMNHDTLISQEDREMLLNDEVVKKVGYEERFDRQIISVILPLVDENRLEGIIYLYIPLATIKELTNDFAVFWLMAAFIFVVIAVFVGSKWIDLLTKPLKEIRKAADKVSQGDFSTRVNIYSKDEIGDLAHAFNHMSQSIQEEDERKKEFLANVSHELRTPVSYVKGYSEAIISGIVNNKEQEEKYLQLIFRESKRMERLVGDLLDLTRLDSQDYKLRKMPLPVAQLMEDAIEKYKPTIAQNGLRLKMKLDPEVIIFADEGRIEQILQNIIDNSLRYTNKGGQIDVILSRVKNMCKIEIKDTGVGISEEDVKNIKQRFYRVNKARTRTDGGTGLGLAIVDKLVTLHQGELKIESTIGVGTKVAVLLPLLEE